MKRPHPIHPLPSHPLAGAEAILERWLGLDPSTIGSAAIERAVRQRMKALGLDDAAVFADRAANDAAERDRLVEEVIVPESWFFRDPQVFQFVRRFVATLAALPGRQPVRILSAPCAAGEEPYSLAMALLDAGLAPEQFSIDAIDVSHAALARARQGVYSANAFRNADLSFRDRWFRSDRGGSLLDEAVRGCVHFAWANLLDDAFVAENLGSGRGPYDVIFCRNLLIYLTPAARTRVEHSIDRLLRPDGLLLLGAAEPPIMKGDWIPAADTSVFALRRGVREIVRTAAPATSPRVTARHTAAARPAATKKPAPVTAPEAPAPLPTLDDVLREAGQLANARRFREALAHCDEHLKRLGPEPSLFFLMGMLHQSAGDLDRAEGCFHKTLYLDAAHEEALLALALLAAQRGDTAMAATYRQSAARVLARKESP
ncbi:MAG: CheR family methyltransferase [Planctomycetia bacterium]|jgi:chemotaxis protein methyltransferase WspC